MPPMTRTVAKIVTATINPKLTLAASESFFAFVVAYVTIFDEMS